MLLLSVLGLGHGLRALLARTVLALFGFVVAVAVGFWVRCGTRVQGPKAMTQAKTELLLYNLGFALLLKT